MMAERMQAEDLDWLLDQVGVPRGSRMRLVLVRRHADGYSNAMIAAELGVEPKTVAGYASRARAKIEQYREYQRLSQLMHEQLRRVEEKYGPAAREVESLRQHAAGLLQALRGKRRAHAGRGEPDPTKAGPLVTIGDVERICAALPEAGEGLQAAGSIEPWRRGPYRGAAVSGRGKPLKDGR